MSAVPVGNLSSSYFFTSSPSDATIIPETFGEPFKGKETKVVKPNSHSDGGPSGALMDQEDD